MTTPEPISFAPDANYWEVTCRGRYSGRRILVTIAEILPPDLTLYVEGTSISPVVAAYFGSRPAPHPSPVATSIIWPRPKAYRMPMTPDSPLYLRKDVPEADVQRLCSDLGCEYAAYAV
jgi:hypothetical protein